MKKIYQYNEIIRVWRTLEEIEQYLKKIKDEHHKKTIQHIKRKIYGLRQELDISDLNEVVRKLRAERKREAGNRAAKVYLNSTEIYEESRKDHEKKKKFNEEIEKLRKRIFESDIMN